MRLNKNGKLARFYMLFDGAHLPNDLCTFWWGLVWRVAKVTLGAVIVLWLVGMFGWAVFIISRAGWRHPGIAGLVIGLAAIIGLMIWKRRSLQFEVVREVKMVVGTRVSATKQRFCPQIDWQEDTNANT